MLDALCRVTVSRFRRDRAVWEGLEHDVLPSLAAEALGARRRTLRAWSGGCASGEEAYTLVLAWRFVVAPRFPGLRLRVLATDVDEAVLERARQARYAWGRLRDLPAEWRAEAFSERDGLTAALAVEHRLGVIHYDVDYDLIAARSNEPLQSVWLAERGSLELDAELDRSARKAYRRALGKRLVQLRDDQDLALWPELLEWVDEKLRRQGVAPPAPFPVTTRNLRRPGRPKRPRST